MRDSNPDIRASLIASRERVVIACCSWSSKPVYLSGGYPNLRIHTWGVLYCTYRYETSGLDHGRIGTRMAIEIGKFSTRSGRRLTSIGPKGVRMAISQTLQIIPDSMTLSEYIPRYLL